VTRSIAVPIEEGKEPRKHLSKMTLWARREANVYTGVEVAGLVRDNSTMTTRKSKLNPARFPGMSPFMAAVVGFVLGESFTDPEIAEMVVSEAENLVYVRQQNGIGFDGIQSLEDMKICGTTGTGFWTWLV